MSFQQYLILSGITLFAAFVQSFSGFGFSLVAISFFTFFLPIDESAVIATMLLLPIIVTSLFTVRAHIRFRNSLPVLLTMLIGLPIGILALVRLGEQILLLGLGVFVLLTVTVNELTVKGKTRKPSLPLGAAAGLLSGMFGGAFSVSGPPVALYFSITIEEKRELKANLLFILLVQVVLRLVIFFAAGVAEADMIKICLVLAVPLAAGGFAGMKLFNRVPSVAIRRVVQVLLVASSVSLILRSI